MCGESPDDVPDAAFETGNSVPASLQSHALRQLALIDTTGVTYRQLPCDAQLRDVLRRHAAARSHGLETRQDFIQEAKTKLKQYALLPDDVYANLRFLGMSKLKSPEDVQEKTAALIDDFIAFMRSRDLENIWQTWHPHRLATAAVYLHLFVAAPPEKLSRWHARISSKEIYIPARFRAFQSWLRTASPCMRPCAVDHNPTRRRRSVQPAPTCLTMRQTTTPCNHASPWPTLRKGRAKPLSQHPSLVSCATKASLAVISWPGIVHHVMVTG